MHIAGVHIVQSVIKPRNLAILTFGLPLGWAEESGVYPAWPEGRFPPGAGDPGELEPAAPAAAWAKERGILIPFPDTSNFFVLLDMK